MGACMKLGGQGDVYDFGGHARCHTTFLDTASGIVFRRIFTKMHLLSAGLRAACVCVCVSVCVCLCVC